MYQSERFELPPDFFKQYTTNQTNLDASSIDLNHNNEHYAAEHRLSDSQSDSEDVSALLNILPWKPETSPSSPSSNHMPRLGWWFKDKALEDAFISYSWCNRSRLLLGVVPYFIALFAYLVLHEEHDAKTRFVYYPSIALVVGTLLVDFVFQLWDSSRQFPKSEFIPRCKRAERLSLMFLLIMGTTFFITYYDSLDHCYRMTHSTTCYRGNVSMYWGFIIVCSLMTERTSHAVLVLLWAISCFILSKIMSPPLHNTHDFGPKLFMITTFTFGTFLVLALREQSNRRFFLLDISVVFSSQQAKIQHSHIVNVIGTMLPPKVLHRISGDQESLQKADVRLVASYLQFDVVHFTQWCSNHSAVELVRQMSALVTRLDHEAMEVGAEKIKTIGDAYQAASGLLRRAECTTTHKQPAIVLFHLANRMHATISDASRRFFNRKGRIGIATGPLVGSIVGSMPYRYDAFGEAAELAATLEQQASDAHTLLCPRTTSEILLGYPEVQKLISRVHDGESVVGYESPLCRDCRGAKGETRENGDEDLQSECDSVASDIELELTNGSFRFGGEFRASISSWHLTSATSAPGSQSPSVPFTLNLRIPVVAGDHLRSPELLSPSANRRKRGSTSVSLSIPGSLGRDKDFSVDEDGSFQGREMSVSGGHVAELIEEDSNHHDVADAIPEKELLLFELKVSYHVVLISLYVCIIFYISALVSLGLEGVMLGNVGLAVSSAVCCLLTTPPIIVTHMSGRVHPWLNLVYFAITQIIYMVACALNEGPLIANLTYNSAFLVSTAITILMGLPQLVRQSAALLSLIFETVLQLTLRGPSSRSVYTVAVWLVGMVILHVYRKSTRYRCALVKDASAAVKDAKAETAILENVLVTIMPPHIVPKVLQRFQTNSTDPIVLPLEHAGVGFLRIEQETVAVPSSGLQAIRDIRRVLFVLESVLPDFDLLLVIKTIGNVLMVGSCLSPAQQKEEKTSVQGLRQLVLLPKVLHRSLNDVGQNQLPDTPAAASPVVSGTSQTDFTSAADAIDDQQLASISMMHPLNAIRLHCGVYCGPVTTAVLGINQVIYDVYGSTVNAASRLLTVGCGSCPDTHHTNKSIVAIPSTMRLDVMPSSSDDVTQERSIGVEENNENCDDAEKAPETEQQLSTFMWSNPFTIDVKGVGSLDICVAHFGDDDGDRTNPHASSSACSATHICQEPRGGGGENTANGRFIKCEDL